MSRDVLWIPWMEPQTEGTGKGSTVEAAACSRGTYCVDAPGADVAR